MAQAQPRPLRILAFGDSLTAGWGMDAQSAFPAQLERSLKAEGYQVEVINAGVSGDTSAGGLARLDWALGSKPDVAIVELGANDGLRGMDPELTYANLDAILEKLKSAKVPVLLAGMLAPPNYGQAYGDQFRQVFARLATKHQVVFYPFFLDGVAAKPQLTQPDGIHPNPEGIRVIVEKILPQVRLLLKSVTGAPA